MISCPSCGASLLFDIAFQQMRCDHCLQSYAPEEVAPPALESEELQEFEAGVYSCPGCGAELITASELEVTAFCPWCGGTSVLENRLRKMEYPAYIVPFQITKEDCKKAYREAAKKAIFTPARYKKPELIDSFRGIYMPYWTYHAVQKGAAKVRLVNRRREGDYQCTDTYEIKGQIDQEYEGYTHDASGAFDDAISECLEPYNVEARKPFSPGYLSGFYADTPDEDRGKYEKQAKLYYELLAAEKLRENTLLNQEEKRLNLSPSDVKSIDVPTEITEVKQVLLPVWFMSYREGDTMTYATVNGQTGKVVADFPLSLGRFLLAALLFPLLSLLLTLKPEWVMLLTSVLMLLGMFVGIRQYSSLAGRYCDSHGKTGFEPTQYRMLPVKKTIGMALFFFPFVLMIPAFIMAMTNNGSKLFRVLFVGMFASIIPAILGGFLASSKNQSTLFRLRRRKSQSPISVSLSKTYQIEIGLAVALCIGAVILYLVHPVYNIVYYTVCLLDALLLVVMQISSFRQQQKLATRKPPQFQRKGGDDRA